MSDFTVRTLMIAAPPTISPKESLRRARTLMRMTNTAELLVVDDGKLVGVLNERDIWKHCPTSVVVLDDKQADELLEQFRVGGIMALHPQVVSPDTSLPDAVRLLAQSGRMGLPVVEDGTPIAFVTETSLMEAAAILLTDKSQEVKC
jgi:acetoin utilization protein AcuB